MGPNIHFYDLKGLCEILEVWRLMGLSHIFGGLGLLFGREFVSFYFGLGLLHGFYFSNALSQPGQTNPTHYFLIKPMTNRFPNPSWTFSNTPLSLSLSLSLPKLHGWKLLALPPPLITTTTATDGGSALFSFSDRPTLDFAQTQTQTCRAPPL